jgi:hypothetical protein
MSIHAEACHSCRSIAGPAIRGDLQSAMTAKTYGAPDDHGYNEIDETMSANALSIVSHPAELFPNCMQ